MSHVKLKSTFQCAGGCAPWLNVNKQIVQKWDLCLCVASNSLPKTIEETHTHKTTKFPDDKCQSFVTVNPVRNHIS